MSRILIVEDEEEMAQMLVQTLSEEGYECDVATNGVAGLKKAPNCDLLLVDVMMPVMNGYEMVEKLRTQGYRMPVIHLTAKGTTKDLIQGLESGADDYLVKPFVLDELHARVKAALRRWRDQSQILSWHDLVLDSAKRTVFRRGNELFLSPTEFSLMELFMRRPDTVLSKTLILENVWHDEGYRDGNIVEIYVLYLRRKTESRGEPRVIHNVKEKGYILSLAELES